MEETNKPLFSLTVGEFKKLQSDQISEQAETILKRIKDLIIPPKEEPDRCRIKKAAEVTGYSVRTIYGFRKNEEIPYEKYPESNILWFSIKELEKWQIDRKNKVKYKKPSEIEISTDNYLEEKRKKKFK